MTCKDAGCPAGVVHACVGQAEHAADQLRLAQQCFQAVGSSAAECDTIPGQLHCYFG